MQIVLLGDSLHEISKPVFWENKKKIIRHFAENMLKIIWW